MKLGSETPCSDVREEGRMLELWIVGLFLLNASSDIRVVWYNGGGGGAERNALEGLRVAQRTDLKEESELPHLGWVEIREAPWIMAQELRVLPSGLAIHPWWPSTKCS